MKKLIYILLLLFNTNILLAQTDTLRNAVEFEIGGRGINYSFNYQRTIMSKHKSKFNLNVGISIGRSNIFNFKGHLFLLPLEIEFQHKLWKDKFWFNSSFGSSFLYEPTGTLKNENDYLIEVNGIPAERNAHQYVSKFALYYYGKLGVLYKHKSDSLWKFGFNMYYMIFYDTHPEDPKKYFLNAGVSILRTF